ncbi:MAG: ATP-dependent Clp protease adaptor ClpS, partial [Muribaculaceae bacterium]|nr:ATP-dependent Clp protease adaptor ClpS [Muribaculaceae bacterium]
DFVVAVLMTVFNKSQAEATALMLKVHHEGSAVIGTYSFDIAMSKTNRATAIARHEGFPLKIIVEEA